MRNRNIFLATALLAMSLSTAEAACQQKRSRDPSYVELAVPDGAIRPASAQDFAFVTDETTYPELVAKVGPPDASQGSGLLLYIWCFADGTELTVSTRDQVVIERIRHDGKQIYKRGKKKS